MHTRLTADAGTYFLPVTTAHTGLRATMLQINTDAVFTTITLANIDGSTIANANGLVVLNVNASTISQGTLLAAPSNVIITNVTMSSGDCNAVLLDDR